MLRDVLRPTRFCFSSWIVFRAFRLEDFLSRVQEPWDLEDESRVKGEDDVNEGRWIAMARSMPEVERRAANGKISAIIAGTTGGVNFIFHVSNNQFE